MSRFASERINDITPYVPGEQPQDKKYVKLNTNENPFSPSPAAVQAVTRELLNNLSRYNDPTAHSATQAIAKFLGVEESSVLLTNGSDEAIAFAFTCYGDGGLCFPDVTYGFYKNIAALLGKKYVQFALNDDFTVNCKDYFNAGKTVVLANPNAQTGIALSVDEIETIIKNNKNNIVIIDQAYADFSNEDAVPLTKIYDNLLVIGTFSKSRSLAGARLGYAVGNENLINDLNKVKFSFNPYNVNSVSQKLAEFAVADEKYFKNCVNEVIKLREELSRELKTLGFTVLPSSANFIAAKHKKIGGESLYLKLKEKGVLVRYFSDERIKDFVRITVGSREQNAELLAAIKSILAEEV